MRRPARIAALTAAAALVAAGLAATATPAGAITGGDPAPDADNVAMLLFYAADPDAPNGNSRYRCSGTLISPTVVLTAAHCTEDIEGDVLVTFDDSVAVNRAEAAVTLPRAAGDVLVDPATGEYSGSATGFVGVPAGTGPVTYRAGTGHVHPDYSGFTDLRNWNDVGVVVLDSAVTDIEPAELAPLGWLDQYSPRVLGKTLFTSVGYGTEVRKPDAGPQKPTPQSYPLIRRSATANGQKLTAQILQTNGNPNNAQAGLGTGGTCFGDSGGPTFRDGYLVTVTSYGYTSNCRYLDGLQRVDIAVAQDWIATFTDETG